MSLYNDASLVMIPSAYKDGKLYSIKPTDGSGDFTFSRGSNLAATRVDENGLIEKGRENLFLQSNQFDTTWVQTRINLTSGQSGYDGSNNAWKLESNDASTTYLSQNIVNSGIQTISLYAKSGTADYFALYTSSASSVWFNLSNGSVGNSNLNIDTQIEDVGNGWYRCSMTYDASITYVRIYVADANNIFTSAVGSSIYIQDAQLEVGLVATDYIETTTTTAQAGILEDMPRLDYSGGASCPSLLLEPTRTNLITQSEYFDSAFWTNDVGTTLTTNAGISPDGNQNATRFESPLSTKGLFTYGAVNNQTISIYIKAGNTVNIGKSVTLFTSTISQSFVLTDEWQRISVSGSASNLFALYPASGDGVNAFIWGAQAESNASYPTSYIPCYGAATTRSLDVCKNTTITDFRTSDASIFVEFNFDSSKTGAFRNVFTTENSTSNNFDLISLQSTSGGVLFSFGISNSGISFSFLSLISGINKAIIRFDRTTKAVKTFLNGVQIDSATAIDIPEVHKIALGGRLNAYAGFGIDRSLGDDINQFAIFPTALTDSECIALTTI